MISERVKKEVIRFQKSEITEYFLYKKLADITKNKKNKKVLERLAKEEKNHYNILQHLKPYFLATKHFDCSH